MDTAQPTALLSVQESSIELSGPNEENYWLALALVFQGWKIQDACKQVGVSRDAFHSWRQKNPDTIERVRSFIEESTLRQLQGLAAVQEMGTMALARDMLAAGTDPAVRLQIWSGLNKRISELQEKHRATGNDVARKYLTGPIQVPIPSTGLQMNILVALQGIEEEARPDNEDIIEGSFTYQSDEKEE